MNKFEHDDDTMFTISGPEVGDGAKADVPTTDRQNKTKNLVFYEVVDAHAHCRLISQH